MAYVRITHDEYDVQGNYGYGWDTVTTEKSLTEAIQMLKCYRENEPKYQHRIRKHRVRNEEGRT